MKTYFAVVAVIKKDDKILILRKSLTDRNYPGKWGFCAGFIKEFEPAEDAILREIKEETRLEADIIRKGKVITIVDEGIEKTWVVMPFLVKSDSEEVKLCSENMEFRWILPKDVKDYDTVPNLEEDLKMFNL